MNLWQYLDYRSSSRSLRRSVTRMGITLAVIHQSRLKFPRVETSDIFRDRPETFLLEAVRKLETLPEGGHLVRRFHAALERSGLHPMAQPEPDPVPIHGSFGWDCVHYGIDGRFYLCRFEWCRHSDPRFDLGGFAADLLRFTGPDHDRYSFCCEAFLSSYQEGTGCTISQDDLRRYAVLASIDRLRRLHPRTPIEAGALIRVMEDAVAPGRRAGTSASNNWEVRNGHFSTRLPED